MITTIQVDKKTKKKLDVLKLHDRESYNSVIERVTNQYVPKADKESLQETIDILSDSETLREIAEALDNYDKGIELKKLTKELNLNV
jgi:hypothetical protein